MRTFSSAKYSVLMATIIAVGMSGCSNDNVKAVDRVEEAAATARAQALEARAAALKSDM